MFTPTQPFRQLALAAVVLLLGSAAPPLTFGQTTCTAAEIREMIRQGLPDAEIDRRCSRTRGLPPWLAGTWEVTQHTGQTSVPTPLMPAPTIEYWRLRVDGATLHVEAIRDAHLPEYLHRVQPLHVSDVTFSDGTLSLTIHRRDDVMDTVTRLRLAAERPDRLEGSYESVDRGTPALPSTRTAGRITLLKKDLHLSGSGGPGAGVPVDPLPRDWSDSFCHPYCEE